MGVMQEFLMWGNCTNQCDFCWQCKKRDETIFLNKEEMISCIEDTLIRLDEINDGDDVLIVGGEILATYYEEVTFKNLKSRTHILSSYLASLDLLNNMQAKL